MRNIAILGSGFIGRFYADSIQSQRSRDKVVMVQSRREEQCISFAKKYDIRPAEILLGKPIRSPAAHHCLDTV